MVVEASAERRIRPLGARFGVFAGLAALLTTVLFAGHARAAEPEPAPPPPPEPAELRQVVETALPRPDFAPSPETVLRWDRETQWTVLAMGDPWDLREDDSPLGRGPLTGLGRFDLRNGQWQATPYAASTVASAIAAVAARGIPVMRELREFKTIRTHRVGCYFKGRGGGLVWRLEF